MAIGRPTLLCAPPIPQSLLVWRQVWIGRRALTVLLPVWRRSVSRSHLLSGVAGLRSSRALFEPERASEQVREGGREGGRDSSDSLALSSQVALDPPGQVCPEVSSKTQGKVMHQSE